MKRENFIEKFTSFIQEKKLIQKNDRVVVGFSGGADSTALIQALWHLRSKMNFTLLAAHVNYNLRGEDSIADAEFVKRFCFDHNISLVLHSIKMEKGPGMESNARKIRFDFFHTLTKQYKANKIALGHQKEDQAETILFRITRGTGYTGLKGITPKSDKIIHPLLPFKREEIETFLIGEKIIWQIDKSNEDQIYSRNKIRHKLLPWIEENINPNITEKLCQTAKIFAETDEIMLELAKRRIFKARLKHDEFEHTYNLNVIMNYRSALRYYIYREIFGVITGSRMNFYHIHFEKIEDLLRCNGSKQVDLPGDVIVMKEYSKLLFLHKNEIPEVDPDNVRILTSIRHRIAFEDYRISMKKLKKIESRKSIFEDRFTAYIDLDKIEMPITLRHRQPGDKFTPFGMEYSKKLKNFLIDEKVPKLHRDKLLLICDKNKIIWVCGLRIDNQVAISPESSNILMIKIEKIAVKKARPAERVKKRNI